MHLQFVSEDLQLATYKTPVHFAEDVKNVLRLRHKKGLTTQKEVNANIFEKE